MKTLVTGGTGFIGQALLPALRNAGHTVTVLTRNARRARLPEGVTAIENLDEMAAPSGRDQSGRRKPRRAALERPQQSHIRRKPRQRHRTTD